MNGLLPGHFFPFILNSVEGWAERNGRRHQPLTSNHSPVNINRAGGLFVDRSFTYATGFWPHPRVVVGLGYAAAGLSSYAYAYGDSGYGSAAGRRPYG